MKPLFFSILIFSVLSPCISQAQQRCATAETRQWFLSENTNFLQQKVATENAISEWEILNNNRVGLRSVITIPVVVHIIYNSPVENISNEQILSQIDILNQDFRALNAEIPAVPAFFQPLVADVEFEFCLATVDPSGNTTTGITRRFTNNSSGIGGTTAVHYSSMGGQDAWDPNRYLNIWVAKFIGGIGGISSFPGVGPAAEDGVEINFEQFGNINVEPPYHLGRTLTHEIGHYFNLEHPWGPQSSDCCADDFVADTPKSCETYIGQCPTHPVVSCDMPDLFMNFMFYTDDDCMGMFTHGQKMRMLATLNTLRTGLLDNNVCNAVPATEIDFQESLKVLSNPAQRHIFFEINSHSLNHALVKLMDLNGRVLFQKTIDKNGKDFFEITGISNGIYLLFFENNGKRVAQKVAVFH